MNVQRCVAATQEPEIDLGAESCMITGHIGGARRMDLALLILPILVSILIMTETLSTAWSPIGQPSTQRSL